MQEVARAKKSTAGGLDGWAWNEIKALPLPWFSWSCYFLELVETTGVWPQGLLDSYIATIPKADGDSTPRLGQRLLSVLPVVYRLGASLGLDHLREWVVSVFSLGDGLSFGWGLVFHSFGHLRRFFPGLVGISCMSWLLMSLSPSTLWTGPFLDCALGRLGLPDWFRRAYFSYHSQVRLGFKLAAGFGEPWCRDGGIPQGCPLSMVFIVALCVPWCRHLEALPDVKPQLYADTSSVLCGAFLVPSLILLGSLLSMFVLLVKMCLLVSVSFLAPQRRLRRL